MKTLKKALACLLVVAMFLTAAPLNGFLELEWPELNLPQWNLPEIDFGGIFSKIAMAADTVASGTCGTSGSGYNQTSRSWKLDSDGVLTISGSGAMTDYESSSDVPWYSYRDSITKVVIENGVTNIGDDAFRFCNSLKSITIPDSVTSIGSYAFYSCDSLASINIPASVTSIGIYAFYDCDSLANITIPDSVTSIGTYAFCNCVSLESITVDEDNAKYSSDAFGVLFNKDKTELIQYPIGNARTEYKIPNSVTIIGTYAFSSCDSLESITFGENSQLKSIGSYAFYSCDRLASVDFGDNSQLQTIGDDAFYSCDKLASVDFGNNSQLQNIGTSAFRGCTSLANIAIPDSVTSIGSSAFNETAYYKDESNWSDGVLYIGNCLIDAKEDISGIYAVREGTKIIAGSAFKHCTSLVSVTIPSGVTSIGTSAFSSCDSLASITIPDSVTSIGNFAFSSCDSLESITFGENSQLKSIGRSAFSSCDSLESITIPASVTSIGDDTFYKCVKLTSVDFGDNSQLQSIGACAFEDCDRLASVDFGDNSQLQSIGEKAFYYCTKLASVDFGDNSLLQSIGDYAFSFCVSLASVDFGDNSQLQSIGRLAFSSCTRLASVDFGDNSQLQTIGDYAFSSCTRLASVDFGDNSQLQTIGDYAFSSCYRLASVDFGDNSLLQCISQGAFRYCDSLVNITIPDSVISIGENAFYSCYSLTSITIPAGVTQIGSQAFFGCSSLEEVYIEDIAAWCNINYGDMYSHPNYYADKLYLNGALLTDLVVPAGVTAIGNYVFYNCKKLQTVSLPYSVESIGNYAFSGCSAMTDISMDEGVQTIGNYAFYNCKKLTAVTVPDSVTSIGDYAFYACSGLANVYLSAILDSVGNNAFYNCSGLGNAYFFGNAPANFGTNVFSGTKSDFGIYVFDLAEETGWTQPTWNGYPVYLSNTADLVTRTIDADNKDSTGVKYIVNPATGTAKVAGYEGTATEVTIPQAVRKNGVKYAVTAIDSNAFQNKGLTQILLPYTIESIGDYAFAGNPGLTEIDIRYKTASLGAFAFMGCTGLTTVKMNHIIPEIKDSTFKNCSSLQNITLGSKVTAIADEAFYKCKQLRSVNLENITSIGAQAFYDCDKLQTITLSRNIATIGDEAFYDCKQLVGAHFTGNHPTAIGTEIFGDTTNDKFYVIYPPTHETWQGKVTDARWNETRNDYQAVPFNAVTQMAIEQGKMQFYIIRVSDKFGNFLEGATVTLDGVSETTYADGYAYLPMPEESVVELEISMLGYHTLKTNHTIEAVPFVSMLLSEDPSTVTPLTCNDKNISTGTAQINVAADDTAVITVAGYSQFPITKYELIQNGNAIASSANGTFSVKNSKFIPDADVYVTMYTADGKTVTEKLNISVINVTVDGLLSLPDDEVLAIETPSDMPIYGKVTIPVKIRDIKSKTQVQINNDEFLVAYGISLDTAETGEKIRLSKLFEDNNKSKQGLIFELKGYIKGKIVGDQTVISEYMLGIGGSIKLEGGMTLYVVLPIRLEAELSAGVFAELKLNVAEDQKPQVSLDLGVNMGLTVRAGIGFKWASAGIYGSGNVGFKFRILPIAELYSVDCQVALGLYVRYRGIFVKWDKKVPVWDYKSIQYFGDNSENNNTGGGDNTGGGGMSGGGGGGGGGGSWSLRVGASVDITDPSNYDYVTRSYLNTRSSWYPSGPPRVGASAQQGTDLTASAQLLQSSAYTDLDPQIITCGDTTMMVYLDDDSTLDDYNYQKLVFSIYSEENNVWSEPQNIVDDNLFDSSPAVTTDGEQYIYITYTKANRAMTDEDIGDDTDEGIAQTMENYSAAMETAVIIYDTVNGTFSDIELLTDNELLDTLQTVQIIDGTPTVLWIENSENDTFLLNGTNSLYKAQLIDGKWVKSLVMTDCGLVKSMDMGTLDGEQFIVLCVDEDKDFLTDDSNIYLIDEANGLSCFTPQVSDYAMPTFASFDGEEQLIWYQGGNLCYVTELNGEVKSILETPSDKLSAYFKLIENNGRYDILFSANNDSETDEDGNLLDPGSDIYGIFYDNGWGSPIKLTDAGNSYYINAFDAYYKGDELLIPYLRTRVTFLEDGSGYREDCDFYSTLVDFNGNITVSDPSFAESDLTDDEKLTVSLNINNNTTRQINGLDITVCDPAGGSVATVTTDSVIRSGENEAVEFTFTLPEEISAGEYTITATPRNGTDADTSDNTVAMCLLYPDLVVHAKQTIIGTKTYIHASVENTGNAASDGTLNITVDHKDGVIHSLSFDSIAPGDRKLFEITTDASFFEGDSKTSVVCVSATNENDINASNNSEYIALLDPTPEEIDLSSVAKQSSVYPLHFSYDKNGGEVTTVELNANTNSFEGIENVDNAAYTLADNKLTFNTAYLNSLAEGEQTFLFTFRDKNNDLQKISVAVYISDTTPEEITGEISIDGNAKVNGILSVNTANLSENTAVFTCQWYSDGSAIQGATQSTYAVRSADVGKSISVTITASGNYAGTFTSPSIAITCEHVFKNWITLTPATCTTDGTQKGSCVCGATSQRDVTAPGHAWSTTCTSNGDGENNTHYQTCTRTGCDAKSDAVAHTWNEGVVAPDPTCEDAGIRTFTCTASGCGATFTEAVDANGHSYGEWIAEIPATCIATGTRGHYDCADCDKHFDADKAEIADLTIAINSVNHVHTTEHEQQAATCTDIGYTAGTFCEDCDKWISGHEEIPAIAHKNKVHHERVESTCSATGTIEYWSCPDCSKNFSDEACTTEATDLTVAINPEAHKWDEGKVTTEPGCITEGVKTYTCQYNSEHTYTESVSATNHKFDVHTPANEATCVKGGNKAYKLCSNCKLYFAEDAAFDSNTGQTSAEAFATEINPDNHAIVNHEAQAPTCTEIGWDAYVTCQREGCNYTTYVEKAANGHAYDLTTGVTAEDGKHIVTCPNCAEGTEGHTKVVDCTYGEGVVKAPTCTKNGYTTHTCTACGYFYTDTETTATGHTFGKWAAIGNDKHERTCTVCADEEGRVEPADCTYGEWTETKAPSCTEKGEKAHTCTVCTNTVTAEVEALGHDWADADCTKPSTCKRCGETSGEAIGHDFSVFVETVDYTCTEKGYDIYKCSRCDATENKNYTDAACRPEADYTVTKQATCEADGEESIFCSACDKALVTTVIEKRAHVYKDNGVKTSATCVAEGVMNTICTNEETAEYAACAHESTRVIPVDKDAHKWETEYTVDKKASCDEAGSKSYHCEYCDAINADSVVEIAKREHNLIDTTVALAPTCSATGIMNQKCDCAETAEYEACDYTTTRVMDKVADAHKAEAEYIQTVAPTCSAVGEEKLYCEYCDAVLDTREVAIDADAHKWETEYTVDVKASCDAAGSKSYHCEYCDAINTESVVDIAKREHNLVDTTVALAPTCSATGIMNQKCDCAETAEYEACDYTTTRVMDKVADAHKAEAEYLQIIAPTCSAVGEEKLYCEYCDAVLDTREVEIDADAHKWETEYTVDKKASCDAAGSKSYHCALCDAKNADSVVEIAKREHNLVDTTVALAPTCSATGTMNQKCDHVGSDEYEACTYTATREIPALGHKWGEWTVTIPATYLQEGEEIRTCNECGTTETHTLDKLPLPDSIVIAEPYTTVKVSDGFVVTSVNKTVADLLAVSNATNVLTATGENADAATVLATGMQLVITDGETVVGCMEIVILGDVDGDGIITAGDARMALRASVGLDVLNAARQKAADTDTSNTIAASDAREILRAAVGLDDPVVWFEKI